MAFLPKKTYSKHGSEVSLLNDREKENVDPFDELLSSPLKQEVQFQPLSFWGEKINHSEPKKKSEKTKYRLYESSDSEEFNSPTNRKRKYFKNSITKTKLQNKNVSQKLSIRRKNSPAASFIKSVKPDETVLLDENDSLVPADVLETKKGQSQNSVSPFNENMEEALILSYKTCDNLKFFSEKPQAVYIRDGYNYSCENTNSPLNLPVCEKNCNKNVKQKFNEIINPKKPKFKMYEDVNDAEIIFKENKINSTLHFDGKMEKSSSPYSKEREVFKFINVKRFFNYPNCLYTNDENFNSLSRSMTFKKTEKSSKQCRSDSRSSFSPNSLSLKLCEDISFQVEPVENINETCVDNVEDSIEDSFYCPENMDGTFCIMNPNMSMMECNDENTVLDTFDFACFNNTDNLIESDNTDDLIESDNTDDLIESDNTDDLIESDNTDDLIELLEQHNRNITGNGALEDSSSTSEDTISELKDEDTVIKNSLEPERNNVLMKDSDRENTVTPFHLSPNEVSAITTGISDLTITYTTGNELSKSEAVKVDVLERGQNYKGGEKDSFLIDLRNVTTKRRGRLNNKYEKNVSRKAQLSAEPYELQNANETEETGLELEQTFDLDQITSRMSVDWNKSVFFSNPIFESTRVIDLGSTESKVSQQKPNRTENILDETSLDHKFTLKPGKKWYRSMSVLKQLQNKTLIEGRLENTKITGRNFESFVQGMLEMQNDKSDFFASLSDITFSSNKKNIFSACMSGYQSILECENVSDDRSNDRQLSNSHKTADDSLLSKSISSSVLERSLLNRTVKVTQPKEEPSAFRSALGLEDRSDTHVDLVQEESSISAKDFILMQCGQEDVLPFEEHFNERTLKNCKKIGEGVYGEVFLSSDSVIKIIPIEGSEKINGEPQKTFEEIISEVVIASKLSNLRKGKKHCTDCFSEMKRCWCVRGKYPKYLLKLWNDYDQLGSGSENDSPVVFEENQLYIILELANGGKDLESFVFSSSAQSLSIFIQATFSLAAAEKAFEFEHRDLHWGNVLISETQNKFITVVLDDIEYKIPTKGVKICIIDFTLSRINHDSCCIFNDLSIDPSLFASEGDYQFEIYRMMLAEVKNDWSLFRPKTNLFWLHYMLDKMIKMVRYKNKKSKLHTKHLKDLKTLESIILKHKDSTNFLLSKSLNGIINQL